MKAPALGLLCSSPFLLGWLFPDYWWATHFVSFLPFTGQALLVVLVLLCFSSRTMKSVTGRLDLVQLTPPFFWVISVSLLMGVLFYFLPIAFDIYGEGNNYRPFLNDVVTAISPETWDWLLTFDLKPATGRRTLLSIYTLIAFATGANYASVFQWIDIAFGMLFSMLWLTAVIRWVKSNTLRLILALGVLGAPLMLVFYGHVDTYAIVYTGILFWLMGVFHVVQNPKKWHLLVLFFGLFILIKLHPLMVLLFPAWVLGSLYVLLGKRPWVKSLLTPKGMSLWVLLPVFIAGACLYFFVFEDHRDERLLQDVQDFDRLFLPLFSPDPPLDRYNLLGWQHLFDVLNVVLWWSPTMLFLCVMLLLWAKKATLFLPEVLILGITLLLFCAFLFMVNPLISMPMDWDLFSIPGVILMMLVLVLASKTDHIKAKPHILSIGLVMTLLTMPVFIVNASSKLLSERLVSVGSWIYKSYYEHSAQYIHQGIELGATTPEAYLEKKEQVMKKLRPWAVEGNDVKFASMCTDNALVFWKRLSDYNAASQQFEEAIVYDPNYALNRWYFAQMHMELGATEKAITQVEFLVKMKYPSREQGVQLLLDLVRSVDDPISRSHYCDKYSKMLETNPEFSSLCVPTNQHIAL